jgi:hypothetical protein
MLRFILAGWNPNSYHKLRETRPGRILFVTLCAAALSVLVFVVLCIPSLLRADDTVAALSQTTNITVSTAIDHSAPAYILRNPDIMLAESDQDAFISITPEALYINKFVYLGKETYYWEDYSTLSSFPAQSVALKGTVFLLPSIMFWGALFMLFNALLASFLYTCIAYFVLQAKEFVMGYGTLWKIAIYATFPAMMIFALTPMLRLGLPIAMILGLVVVVWVVFCLLGTTLLTEKQLKKKGA